MEISYFDYVKNYFGYLMHEITHPGWGNYFYALLGISLVVWLFEIFFPWRREQKLFRKDFWLDFFYMFFNFFIFNLIAFIALSKTFEQFLLQVFSLSRHDLQWVDLSGLSDGWRLLIFFVVTDFVQWATHILLHRIPWLWRFHQVHHSVEEMGFAAHLRYHWMENVVYKSLLYLPISFIGGFVFEDLFIVHFVAIVIGHLNHANVKWTYGPLKYIFNNPVMHLWHHAYHLPKNRKYGVNYGISLSLWDYLFGTKYIPHDNGEIELGYPEVEKMPESFWKQLIYGFWNPK